MRLWWDLQATTRFCELRHEPPHSSQDDETVPAPESAWRSEMTGPFADDFVVDAANPLEKLAQMAFKRSLGLAQRYHRTIDERGQLLVGTERDMAQDQLIGLCALYCALPDVERKNLGKDVEDIVLLMTEELVWVEGDEGPADGLLAEDVQRVFLGATMNHPLGFIDEPLDDDACGNWEIHDAGRNRGGQALAGSVIWLGLPRRWTDRCGCTLDKHISHDAADDR